VTSRHSQATFDDGSHASASERCTNHITKESVDRLLVQHQFNSGDFFEVIGDGSIEQQVGVAAKGPDEDCGYGMGVESVLYSPPKGKELGLIED